MSPSCPWSAASRRRTAHRHTARTCTSSTCAVGPESLDNPAAAAPAIRHSWALLPGPSTRRAGQPHQARPLATRERIDARATVETMTGARLVTVLCADVAMQRTLIARHCVQESPNHCHPLSGLGRSLVRAGRRRARSFVISEGGVPRLL